MTTPCCDGTRALESSCTTNTFSRERKRRRSHIWSNAGNLPAGAPATCRRGLVARAPAGWQPAVLGHDHHSRRCGLERTLVEIAPQRLDLQYREAKRLDLSHR